MNRLICAIAIVACTGCSRIPEGATFERIRRPFPSIFLSDQKLSLPWVPLTRTGANLWCFSNLSFTDSKARVRLEIDAGTRFDPRKVGGAGSLKIYGGAGDVNFLVNGPLQDQGDDGSRARWASQYFRDSRSPGRDRSVSYYREPDIDVKIESAGDYCVSLEITAPSVLAGDPRARVVLTSAAK